MQNCDSVWAALTASSSDQSIRPRELRVRASGSMLPRELIERRGLAVRSGFGTSCLQSEMILPHMLVQPDSFSLRHMFMHSRKSQLASRA